MVGFKFVGAEGEVETLQLVAGGTIAAGDLVELKTNGTVQVATTGTPILGYALNAAVISGTVYVVKGTRMRGLMANDNLGTTFASTHVGGRFDMIGATGAQLVDTSTVLQTGADTDAGQLLCRAYNPQGYGFDADTTVGLFEIIERQ